MSITNCGDSRTSDVNFFKKNRQFPKLNNGKINTEDFIESAKGIITIVDKLGSVFAPVKYDMSGNVEKIIKCYEVDKDRYGTLHDLVLFEKAKGGYMATEALLWLNRALHFIEIFLLKILEKASENPSESIKSELIYAYGLTLKQYHNWMTQKVFKVICSMCPTKCQLYKSMEMENMEVFIKDAENYVDLLSVNRREIHSLYENNNLVQGAS